MANKAKKNKKKSRFSMTWHQLKKNKVAMVSLVVLLIIVLVAVLAPVLAPYGYEVTDKRHTCLLYTSATAVSVTLIFLGVLLTNLKVYDCLAKVSGAGTLVPITGFANSVASPALEFKAEGFVSGLAAKMFVIAGPVIVYGISASVIYGIILWLIKIV